MTPTKFKELARLTSLVATAENEFYISASMVTQYSGFLEVVPQSLLDRIKKAHEVVSQLYTELNLIEEKAKIE